MTNNLSLKNGFPALSEDGSAYVDRKWIFSEAGYHVWCGSVVEWDRAWWLFYSRWPTTGGFDAWVTASEIAVAQGEAPCGPFVPTGRVVLGAHDGHAWDGSVAHNPTVVRASDSLFLAYTGNRGPVSRERAGDFGVRSAEWWEHRNHQRVGVATALHPLGPWTRPDHPTLDVTPGAWDCRVIANPSLCRRPDGRWMMIYKAVGDGPPPFGGRVRHGVALANSPVGPYRKFEGVWPFDVPTSNFPAEDPFVWHDPARACFRAFVKDMHGAFTGVSPSVAAFVSADGFLWIPDNPPLVLGTTLIWEDGRAETMQKVERPQLTFNHEGLPVSLQVACLPQGDSGPSFSLAILL